ncbi:hypothetical protein BD310DRAFT_917127 [Dichomitus squalens]|uniref:Uncharacterized protein n=1 Tax=Dichomitus squalens TaxID=114155 RepID=A0A4Q9Q6Y6_9APHY|nr:hypothetical protein BD310DRAFT_917127 [Dichomitus squalens]
MVSRVSGALRVGTFVFIFLGCWCCHSELCSCFCLHYYLQRYEQCSYGFYILDIRLL